MFLNRPLNSTVKCMAETCIRGLRMEGVNTIFANFNENWHPGGLSCADREMSRLTSWKGLSSQCCTIYVRAQRQDPSTHRKFDLRKCLYFMMLARIATANPQL